MSKTKKNNSKPAKYQELNDFELEVVCGGSVTDCGLENVNGKDYTPETIAAKSDAA